LIKKRFGIAVSSEVAEELDMITEKFNTDRSKVVEYALRSFLMEYKHHYSKCHKCVGILVISRKSLGVEISNNDIYSEFKEVILSYSHHHVENRCIEVLVLSGSSEIIADLHNRLLRAGCECRYIPLHSE